MAEDPLTGDAFSAWLEAHRQYEKAMRVKNGSKPYSPAKLLTILLRASSAYSRWSTLWCDRTSGEEQYPNWFSFGKLLECEVKAMLRAQKATAGRAHEAHRQRTAPKLKGKRDFVKKQRRDARANAKDIPAPPEEDDD